MDKNRSKEKWGLEVKRPTIQNSQIKREQKSVHRPRDCDYDRDGVRGMMKA